MKPHYFSDKNSEIDFVLQYGTEIIPVEAKSGENKSAPSFKKYVSEHKPQYTLRFSKRMYIAVLRNKNTITSFLKRLQEPCNRLAKYICTVVCMEFFRKR